jgi:hypothetical protein
MLSVQSAQHKLQGSIISTYQSKIYQATTLLDLRNASKIMFSEVSELLLLDEVFTVGKKIDPQDMPRQEKKEKLDFKETVMIECE